MGLSIKAEISSKMTDLYLMFTQSYFILDEETGEVIEQSFRWTNQVAEELYSRYQAILLEYQTKELVRGMAASEKKNGR